MAKRERPGRKVRVEFRQNRQQRRRADDWTKKFHEDGKEIADTARSESVRPKGELSRKRTIIVDDADAPAVAEALWRRGTVTRVHGLICYVDDDGGAAWECTVRRILRTRLIEQRSPVTVGDRVWFAAAAAGDAGEAARVGVIERVEPRRSVLSRREFRGREHAMVANADQLLIVASIAKPRLKPHLIDRYLVAAEKGGLRPLICFTKCDLDTDAVEVEDDEKRGGALTIAEIEAEFRELGYACLRTSAAAGQGLEELRAALHGHITVLSGQSGVGKSSLINALQPGLALAVAEVSEENEKGRHTTSHAQLLRLDFGGYVVDTPGIRQFGLWDVDPAELEACFVEIAQRVAACKFPDCTHRHETDCAVQAAVETGAISARRYVSYLKMYDEMVAAMRGW